MISSARTGPAPLSVPGVAPPLYSIAEQAMYKRGRVVARRRPPPGRPAALPPGNSDLRRRVGVQSGRPDEIVPGEERKGCYYRVRSENGCRSRATTANPQRILKGTAVPLSRAPRLGSRGGFFASFLTGQKGRTQRQNAVSQEIRQPKANCFTAKPIQPQGSSAGRCKHPPLRKPKGRARAVPPPPVRPGVCRNL